SASPCHNFLPYYTKIRSQQITTQQILVFSYLNNRSLRATWRSQIYLFKVQIPLFLLKYPFIFIFIPWDVTTYSLTSSVTNNTNTSVHEKLILLPRNN